MVYKGGELKKRIIYGSRSFHTLKDRDSSKKYKN